MEEQLIAISQRRGNFAQYWIMIVGIVLQGERYGTANKLKTFSEGENPLLLVLKWPNDRTWKIIIVITTWITILTAHFMLTKLFSLWFLIALQQICSLIYAFDFLLAIIHRSKNLPGKISPYKRDIKWLVVDGISLIPFTLIYVGTVRDINSRIIFHLSCNTFLRAYRIHYFFAEASTAPGVSHLGPTLFQYSLYLFQSLFSFSVWWMVVGVDHMYLEVKDWNNSETNIFIMCFYFSLMTLSNTGFGDIIPITTGEKIVSCIAMLTGFALTSAVLVGSLTTDLLRREKPREKYRSEYEVTMKRLNRLKMEKQNRVRILKDINKLWNYKRGVTDLSTMKLFPIPLRKEIGFDIAFGLLNRSPIFSVQDRSFLRSVSLALKNRTYMPGDEICHPAGVYHKMLCVASGVIEILSRENDDTPIISFTAGTLLCEVSLFMPLPVRTIIRAATIVELQILETTDFYHLILNHPENYAAMREDILERYRQSRKIDIFNDVKSLDPEENANYRFQRLKKVIEDLKKDEADEYLAPNSSTSLFKSKMLHMYTLIENIPKVKTIPETVVRKKVWILRPRTPILSVWRHFMFAIVTAVIFSYPYLAAFVRSIGMGTFTFLLFVQIAYTADIVLQCITAIESPDLVSYKTTVKEIIAHRLKSYGFYLDVLSAYQLELFAPLFNFGNHEYTTLLLSQNKLFKIWYIPAYFRKTENELSTHLILIRMVKYIYFMVWLLHFCSALLYLEACPLDSCDPHRWFSSFEMKEAQEKPGREYTDHPYAVSLYMAMMGTSTCGFGNIKPTSMVDVYMIMIVIILGLVTVNYCIAEISVTFKHKERTRTEYQEQLFAIDRFLVEHNLPNHLRKRVSKYFQIRWSYDRGNTMQRDIPLEQLPNKLRKHMLMSRLKVLQAVPLFKGANPGFMAVLAKGCKVRVIPENEIIVYAGGLDKEMYILQNGYCTVTDRSRSLEPWIIGPLTSFGEVEMIQGNPITMNVKTLTHVRIICIEYSTYLRAVTKYPNVRRDIEFLIETKGSKIQLVDQSLFSTSDDNILSVRNLPTISKWRFISNSVINVYKYDKSIGLNYWTPFKAWKKFQFLKFFFLPYVIKPDSIFLTIWMTIRITSSVMIGFIAPIYLVLPEFNSFLEPIILSLQVISWIDLYITFHVAYYNHKGILTFHPAKTVVHYAKSNFALDFFLVFPYFWIPEAFGRKERNFTPSLLLNGPGLIKVFQFYKFLQACSYYESDILKRADTLKFIKYIPTILLITSVSTGILILIECETFDENEPIPSGNNTMAIYRRNIKKHCSRNLNYSHTIGMDDNFQLYVIAFYWITTCMSTSGFGDIVPHDLYTISICIFLVLLGLFLYGCMFASIASSKINIHYNIVKYRTRLREMAVFLEKEHIDKKMQDRFVLHYLYVWKRTLGHMPQSDLSQIHTALKQDIVDFMYEKTLRKVSLFSLTKEPFIRSIGKYIDEVYFLKGETIVKQNHILTDLYIIYKGEVNLWGAENTFIASMGPGGLFGNISDKPDKLSSITAIAETKVELLRLRNEDFYKTLLNYPEIMKEIMLASNKTQDYILPYVADDLALDDINIEIPQSAYQQVTRNFMRDLSRESIWTEVDGVTNKGRFFFRKSIYKDSERGAFNFVILSDSWLYDAIRLTNIVLGYISCFLVSYVFAFQDSRPEILTPYFLIDIFFFVKIFLEFHFTYFDNRGDHIHVLKLIRTRYLSSKSFYYDIFANFPFEIISTLLPNNLIFPVMTFLRLNRLLRFFYILEYYRSKINSLTAWIILLEVGTLSAWITLTIHLSACTWYLFACPIIFCSSKSWLTEGGLNLEDDGKFERYISCVYYIVTVITTTGYGDIVPRTQLEIIFSTFVVIMSHFLMLLCSASFLSMIGINSINFVKYDECIMQLKKDMSRQKVSKYQMTNMWHYLQALWLRESGNQIPQFIETAPYIMRCDVYSAMYGKHVSSSYIFRDLDIDFLRQLTIYMVRYVFFPGNYIVQQGDNDGTMYFIHRGEVSVMTIHKDLMETIHYNVRDNDQFGIIQGLVFGEPHYFSYRAETEVEILSLSLNQWQHLFKFFPKVKPIIYERLKSISNL